MVTYWYSFLAFMPMKPMPKFNKLERNPMSWGPNQHNYGKSAKKVYISTMSISLSLEVGIFQKVLRPHLDELVVSRHYVLTNFILTLDIFELFTL